MPDAPRLYLSSNLKHEELKSHRPNSEGYLTNKEKMQGKAARRSSVVCELISAERVRWAHPATNWFLEIHL